MNITKSFFALIVIIFLSFVIGFISGLEIIREGISVIKGSRTVENCEAKITYTQNADSTCDFSSIRVKK